jgi:hypothetical protein
LELTQGGFPTNGPPRWLALYGYLQFSWEEKLVAPLIAAPNGEMREITILFCKQIGQSPNMSYAKCRMGLREKKMEMAGNGFSSHPIFVS